MYDMPFIKDLKDRLEKLKQIFMDGSAHSFLKWENAEKIFTDIAAFIKKYEEEYIDFRNICNHLSVTVFVADATGKTIYVNPAYLSQTGLQEKDLIGYTIEELQKNKIIQCDVIPNVLREGKPVNEIGYAIPTGYRGFISGIPVRENGQIRYVITTDWDANTITEIDNLLKSLRTGKTSAKKSPLLSGEWEVDEELMYVSNQMRILMSLVKTIAQTDVTVLITGETGTGKEVLSNTIVRHSKRADKPFIKINCAAVPQELLESELFGYEEGAFTGARKGGRKGAFEQADGGTILLDEIGELPFQIQAKLLRALQEREITRIGGQKTVKLDLRVIAATNRDLLEEIKQGRFREDLYYRLNIMPLELPPLRERTEDIPFLAGRFLEEFNGKYERKTYFDSNVMNLLLDYQWPGNIRELRNLIERLVILCTDSCITGEDVQGILGMQSTVKKSSKELMLKQAVIQLEIRMIKNAIQKCGSKRKAAEELGINHSTLIRKCQIYGID